MEACSLATFTFPLVAIVLIVSVCIVGAFMSVVNGMKVKRPQYEGLNEKQIDKVLDYEHSHRCE